MALLGNRRLRATSEARPPGDAPPQARPEARAEVPAPAPATAADLGGRPPSVPEEVWAAVPEELRDEAIELAARELRRCVHPEETVRRLLSDRGLPVSVPRKAGLNVGGLRPRRPGAPAKGAAPAQQRHDSVPGPQTQFGEAVGRALGLPADASARAEETVLAAIRAQPVAALSDPGCLGRFGASLSRDQLESLADLVQAEADRVIADFRARKDAGDPAYADWVDPDGWSYGLADAERDCAPSM